jgi:putative ABC transport system permease protein
MKNNYINILLRNLTRNKTFSLITIIGLAIGIACTLLIVTWVKFELSSDNFNKNAERIYRVRNDRIYSDKHDKSAGCPPALSPTLKKEFPEILESARLRGTDVTFIDVEKKIFDPVAKAYYADPSFLKIFTIPFLKGFAQTSLEEPNTVILSRSISHKYFGENNPVDKLITLSNDYGKQSYKVTGLFEDIPENSHVKFDILISYKSLVAKKKEADFYWGWNAFNTYILLSPKADARALEAKFPAMIEKYKNYEKDYKREYLLQPLRDIHLRSNIRFEPEVNGSEDTVRFLSIIALFILILAWVNYANLSTSQSLTRGKEVGVKKVLGSNKSRLIKQFLTEAFLINIIALSIALIFAKIALPFFNQMISKTLSFHWIFNDWAWLAVMFIAGALLAGIYPAFVLSSFSPLTAFKTKLRHPSSGFDLRKGLVIFQFAISIILIASTLLVYKQLSYMRNQDLGANINQIVILKTSAGESLSYAASTNFKDVLLTIPGIKNASLSASVPGKSYSNASSGVRKYGSQPKEGTQGFFIDVDENYFNLFEVPLVAGRYFNRQSKYNGEIIINEEAVKVYGFKNPEDAVNKKMIFDGFNGQSIEIVGVTKNYHQLSLKSSLQPVVFNPVNAQDVILGKYFSLKIDSRNIKQTLRQIELKWKEIFPNQPFEYQFLDEIFGAQYKSDMQFGKIFGLFTFLAIMISCLGLFGLVSYTHLQRTKEIGIRRTNGASIIKILFLLTHDFTKWVLIAFILACPIAWYAMTKWLQSFAYKTEMSWWIFAMSGVIALLIALLTVSWQSWRAATRNPVEALRYE